VIDDNSITESQINKVMKNFKFLQIDSLNDTSKYNVIEDHIYSDSADDGNFKMAMPMELEEGEDSQYPLEDILDEYLVHIEEFLVSETEGVFKCIFGGDLEGLQKLKLIVGKRAYNKEFVDEKGTTRVKFIIE